MNKDLSEAIERIKDIEYEEVYDDFISVYEILTLEEGIGTQSYIDDFISDKKKFALLRKELIEKHPDNWRKILYGG